MNIPHRGMTRFGVILPEDNFNIKLSVRQFKLSSVKRERL